MATVIISAFASVIVGSLALAGVIYQTNKNYDRQKEQSEVDRQLLKQEFDDYQKFLHQINKDIKDDIDKLSSRVDEHNNYGKRIPVLEAKMDDLASRVLRLEDK